MIRVHAHSHYNFIYMFMLQHCHTWTMCYMDYVRRLSICIIDKWTTRQCGTVWLLAAIVRHLFTCIVG